jgi:hypothetical protein
MRAGISGVWTFALLERVKGIEPSLPAWEADVLPLNYTRKNSCGTQFYYQFQHINDENYSIYNN